MSKPSKSSIDPGFGLRWAGFLGLLATVALSSGGLLDSWDQAFADTMLSARLEVAPYPLSPRIFPVDLTDSAERNLGETIDSRVAFSQLLQILSDGQLAGAMDFLFQGTKDPSGDRALAEAARGLDGLVLPIVPVDPGVTRYTGRVLTAEEDQVLQDRLWHPKVLRAGRIPEASTFLLPYPALARSSRLLGHIGLRPDRDGVYRRVPLFYRWKTGYLPSLALALAAHALRVDPSQVMVEAGRAVVLPTRNGSVTIPVDESGAAWIPFASTWVNSWPRVPLDKLLSVLGDEKAEEIQLNQWDHGLVIAADLTTSRKDFGAVPIDPIYPLSGIHTSLLNGILTGSLIVPLGWGPKVLLTALVALLGLGLSRLPDHRLYHGGFLALALVLLGGEAAAWWFLRILPWVAVPTAGLFVAWGLGWAVRLVQGRDERLLMRGALGRYLPQKVAERVLTEHRIDLEPANKELTLLFSDIVGFTRWSSEKSPEEVHAFLSSYFETMSQILFDHGATIDKFIGDGILAFFGDPVDQSDHADRALGAALAMQAAVRGPTIRIGINTGTVLVGNLGSRARVEYTVIGAEVNLASRLESHAPPGGILVSESTVRRAKPVFLFADPQNLQVKGLQQPITARVLRGRLP